LNSIPTRVLIVDDNPLHVDILVTAFGRLGTADIVTALDGYEAKAMLDEAKQAFDLWCSICACPVLMASRC
jgi:CheY-like chemotaxis protein